MCVSLNEFILDCKSIAPIIIIIIIICNWDTTHLHSGTPHQALESSFFLLSYQNTSSDLECIYYYTWVLWRFKDKPLTQ